MYILKKRQSNSNPTSGGQRRTGGRGSNYDRSSLASGLVAIRDLFCLFDFGCKSYNILKLGNSLLPRLAIVVRCNLV